MKNRPEYGTESELMPLSKCARKHGRNLTKNMTVAAALVISVVTLRCGAFPGLNQATDVVVSALNKDLLDDDRLGKLSFVSAMFPEAALVFGEQTDNSLFREDEILHAWSEAEPYLLVKCDTDFVPARTAGQVTNVRRESGGTWAVTIGDSRECVVYGDLQAVIVSEGEAITSGEALGYAKPEQAVSLEVRSDGVSVDPIYWRVSSQ